jgi:16S rRNA (guanine527-N7)-methyltransferase
MTEDEAKVWLTRELNVSRETIERLNAFSTMVIEASATQNLISASTIPVMWQRHIVDSAQLLLHTQSRNGIWIDLGTGAGFPGIVIALLTEQSMILVESRRKRSDFLADSLERLGLSARVSIHGGRLEMLPTQPCSVISARAFAPLSKIFDLAARFSHSGTVWLLPKGRTAREELESVTGTWQGVFHVKQSKTNPESTILVAQDVRRRKNR